MTDQGLLNFESPAVPEVDRAIIAANADPKTSHLAAEEFTKSGARKRQKTTVLELLRIAVNRHGGMSRTSAELAAEWGMDRHAVARRLPDLEADGLVRRMGVRNCGVGGGPAVTWIDVRGEGC